MNATTLQNQIDAMLNVLRTFDLEEEYCAGHIKRTGEFWTGRTFVVSDLWFSFKLYYHDLKENPWRVELYIVADDHTSHAGCSVAATKEKLIEELESEEGKARIGKRIDKLAADESGFYWP